VHELAIMMNEQSPSTIRALRKIEQSSGGKARYYEHVNVLTLNGDPVIPYTTRLRYNILLSDHNIIDIRFTANTIEVMLDDKEVSCIIFEPKYGRVQVRGDNILKFRAFGYIQDHQFIETPTVRYYSTYTFELYNEHFELVDQFLTTSSLMRPIKSIVQFEKFSVAGDCVLDYTDLKREGNYIYIEDTKYAISYFGSHNYLISGMTTIPVKHINTFEVTHQNFPDDLIGRGDCHYVYRYEGQYFGKTWYGEIIGLYSRSKNSGSRTKPARHF